MPLTSGTRIGSHEITALLGTGGMGEVYRATDTNLGRQVAIKVLPDAFAHDPERLARFEREAKTLASLNHPNVAIIHGLEKIDGLRALVMELVEGPTLADRIAKGPISVDEALPIARQIAEALEAAHEQGIIHRDLKPANIKLCPDGVVKVLDFGLAKALEPGPGGHIDATASPTITSPAMMTGVGMLLGTAAYMSPEQARGKAVDKRSDVWAFGCVLYEMLTGQRAFDGEHVADTLAAVVRAEPTWDALPDGVPSSVRMFLRRCLEKNRKQRLHDIADMRLALEGAFEPLMRGAEPTARSSWWHVARAATFAVVTTALMGVIAWAWLPRSTLSTVARFTVTLEPGQDFSNPGRQVLAISPDGTRIAYVASGQLYLRSMWDRDAALVQGTHDQGNILNPVFSPDSRSIAFWSDADGTIKRIPISGGPAITICQAERPWGITWDASGILFGQGTGGVMRVPADGGEPEVLVRVREGEIADSPQLLPDGESVLFTVATSSSIDRWERAHVVVQSLRSGERTTVVEGGSDGRFLSTGHLVYAQGGALFAARFDVRATQMTGPPVPIVEAVGRAPNPDVQSGVAHFSVSEDGALIYRPARIVAGVDPRQLVRLDRKGGIDPLELPPGPYEGLSVSPDGRFIALGTNGEGKADVWIFEVSGASAMRRLTFGGNNRYPVWSPDGERVAFQSDREGDLGIFWQRADGAGTAERLTQPEHGVGHFPEGWAPSGDRFVFTSNTGSGRSLWSFSLRDRKSEPLGAQNELGTFSKASFPVDGRWVAYTSNESGGGVYVQPFPPSGGKYLIAQGGRLPLWSRQGAELFFVSDQRQLVVVRVAAQTGFSFTNATTVATGPLQIDGAGFDPRAFDVGPDGSLFGFVDPAPSTGTASAPPQIEVVLNWTDELKRLVPTN
jgi:serine/threonine-protein kinase